MVVVVNLVGALIAPMIAFSTAMSAFSRPSADVKADLACFEVFLWCWSPLAMSASHFFHAPIPVLILLAVTWAVFMGYVFDWLFRSKPSVKPHDGI